MNTNKPKSLHRTKLIFIIVFFLILFLPLTLLSVFGPDEYDKEAFQESEIQLVPLNWDNYITGNFHSSIEAWFSKYYPLRSDIVRLYNGIKHSSENSKPTIAIMKLINSFGSVYRPTPPAINSDSLSVDLAEIYLNPNNKYATINSEQLLITPEEPTGFKGNAGVYIGKSGYLYESTYIDEYYGFAEPYTTVTPEGIQETVSRLEYIQAELKERYGITMLYVITPSKASHCDEYIPDYYINRFTPPENYTRPVEIMRAMLKNSSINYLDSTEYYKEIGLLATFPKTGIHWNHVASFETTAKLVQMYAEITGEQVKIPRALDVISSPNPVQYGNSDVDIFNILYGAFGGAKGTMDSAYYMPQVTVDNPNAPKINVLIQGGSFTTDIEHYLDTYNVSDTRRIYYNGTANVDTWDKNANPWTTGIYAWETILNDYNVIIFEQNEQQIRSGHITNCNWSDQESIHVGSNAVYDSLYEFLKATE